MKKYLAVKTQMAKVRKIIVQIIQRKYLVRLLQNVDGKYEAISADQKVMYMVILITIKTKVFFRKRGGERGFE